MRQNIKRPGNSPMGFSIIEIVVTLAIIGILVLILVPVVSSRSREARIRAAEQDIEHLANAEERAAIDTDYMYRFYVLDDVIGGDGNPNNIPNADLVDGTRDEDQNNVLNNPANKYIFISLETQQVLIDATIHDNQFAITTNPSSESNFGWHGPYLNWRRDVNNNDWPDDPWGNDYLFFTRAGALGPADTQFEITRTIGGTNYTTLRFDRPTILSMGPDGLPGDVNVRQFGVGDDIFRGF